MGNTNNMNKGCMMLFGLPFVLTGLAILIMIGAEYFVWKDAQGWVPTEAKIFSVRTRQIKSLSSGARRTNIVAVYQYKSGGGKYSAGRVDNFGQSYASKRLVQERLAILRQAKANGTSVTCFVNPQRPVESVLFRDFNPQQFVAAPLFGFLFAAAGFSVMVQAWRSGKKTPVAQLPFKRHRERGHR